jgi:hypothetical protein
VRVCARLCFAFLLVLVAPPLFARPAAMTLYTASSEPFTVYVAGPKDARTGVVLVHDWFGVSPFYTVPITRPMLTFSNVCTWTGWT